VKATASFFTIDHEGLGTGAMLDLITSDRGNWHIALLFIFHFKNIDHGQHNAGAGHLHHNCEGFR
jgi:hypothetical protein